jgi:hypothetical protein
LRRRMLFGKAADDDGGDVFEGKRLPPLAGSADKLPVDMTPSAWA